MNLKCSLGKISTNYVRSGNSNTDPLEGIGVAMTINFMCGVRNLSEAAEDRASYMYKGVTALILRDWSSLHMVPTLSCRWLILSTDLIDRR